MYKFKLIIKIFSITFILFLLLNPKTSITKANDIFIVNGQMVLNCDYKDKVNADIKQISSISETTNKYIDYANGYSLLYPKELDVDTTLLGLHSVIKKESLQIEIYYDNFKNKSSDADSYILYGNYFLQNGKDHTLLFNQTLELNGYKTHVMSWNRRKLSRIENDKNNYICAELIKNENEVYTIFIKSSDPIDNPVSYLEGLDFTVFERQGTPYKYLSHARSRTIYNKETQTFFNKYFSPSSPLRWGIFEPSAPKDFTALTQLESNLEYPFNIVVRYQALSGPVFPEQEMQNAYNHNKCVELTLQTILYVNDHDDDALAMNNAFKSPNASIVYDILDGHYDAYFKEYATQLKAFGHPVLFRLNNEMNGDWCWYSAYYTSKDAQLYRELWKYIYTLFENNGVTNVIWVWNPHDRSNPDFQWNHSLMYYPGDEYVDVIGMTGYNNGTYFPGETWRTFTEIYDPLYTEYDNLFDKPFMITEFGSNTYGGNKSEWIDDMFNQLNKYPKLKVAIWWNSMDYDLAKQQPGRIYRLNDDTGAMAAFKRGLNSELKQ